MTHSGGGGKKENCFVRVWREFWCEHIWKVKETVPLRETFKHIDDIKIGFDKVVYALYEECLKCRKKRITESSRPKSEFEMKRPGEK